MVRSTIKEGTRSIKWPSDIDPTARKFIEAVMTLDPEERLGCPNTDHDINVLKEHEFFEGIDFT